jgi:hypothetical protein
LHTPGLHLSSVSLVLRCLHPVDYPGAARTCHNLKTGVLDFLCPLMCVHVIACICILASAQCTVFDAWALQVLELQQNSGHSVPAFVTFPGTDVNVTVFRMCALTGGRFVNHFILEASTGASAKKLPRNSHCEPGTRQLRSTATATSKSGTDSAVDALDAASSAAFASIFLGQAPTQLTLTQAASLMQASFFYAAEAIAAKLTVYLEPMLQEAPVDKVY